MEIKSYQIDPPSSAPSPKPPPDSLLNWKVTISGFIALAILIAGSCVVGGNMVNRLVNAEENHAQVCERAVAEHSGWMENTSDATYARKEVCPDFLAAGMVPCGLGSHPGPKIPAFCASIDPRYRFSEDAPVVTAYHAERGDHGELVPIGEFLHSDVTFY